jgi:hypothetical protein
VPPSFSLAFPAGSLPTSIEVQVAKRITAPFPSEAGVPVPGTAYDVTTPAGTTLNEPARIELSVPPELLAAGQAIRLSVAVLREDGSVVTFGGTYDLTNGVLAADIDEIGSIAAVVSADAIALATGAPDALGGGSFPAPPLPPAPVGAAPAGPGELNFSATCSPEARQCFSSGLLRIWADDAVRERLGDDLYLMATSFDADFTFSDFDSNGLPTSIVGSLVLSGDLRARINSAVSNYDVEESVSTGSGTGALTTSVQVTGSVMVIELLTTAGEELFVDTFEPVEYEISGIGTSEMLTVQAEIEVELQNENGPPTIGEVTIHVRLRR